MSTISCITRRLANLRTHCPERAAEPPPRGELVRDAPDIAASRGSVLAGNVKHRAFFPVLRTVSPSYYCALLPSLMYSGSIRVPRDISRIELKILQKNRDNVADAIATSQWR